MSVFTHASSHLRRSLSFLRSPRTNAERSAWPRLIAVLLITASVGVLGGCDFYQSGGGDGTIAVAGVWELVGSDWDNDGNDNVERWTITASSIHYESTLDGTNYTTTYRADIVEYVNGRLNAGDTALTSGGPDAVNPGFAIIRYTEVNNAGTGEVGKYNIFRWAKNDGGGTKRDFTQGSKDADSDPNNTYVNDVFDTAGAAETGAINAAGYFGFASSGAEQIR